MVQYYTVEEVAVNNGEDGKPFWMIIKGKVYDVTPFLSEHPGGEDLMKDYAGKDGTKAFNRAGHSSDAVSDLKKYEIGEVSTQNVRVESNKPQRSIEDEYVAKQKKRIKLFFCF